MGPHLWPLTVELQTLPKPGASPRPGASCIAHNSGRTMGMAIMSATSVPRHSTRMPSRRAILRRPSQVPL